MSLLRYVLLHQNILTTREPRFSLEWVFKGCKYIFSRLSIFRSIYQRCITLHNNTVKIVFFSSICWMKLDLLTFTQEVEWIHFYIHIFFTLCVQNLLQDRPCGTFSKLWTTISIPVINKECISVYSSVA